MRRSNLAVLLGTMGLASLWSGAGCADEQGESGGDAGLDETDGSVDEGLPRFPPPGWDETRCEPLEAAGAGTCAQVLGWKFDGDACVALSGCECVGVHCPRLSHSEEHCWSDGTVYCGEPLTCEERCQDRGCWASCAGAGYLEATGCGTPPYGDGELTMCGPDVHATCSEEVDYQIDVWCQGFGRVARPISPDAFARVIEFQSDIGDGDDDPTARAGAAWALIAAYERASVDEFLRFAQQLISLDAPSQLIAAARRAAKDEVRHAQLARQMAARHGTVIEVSAVREAPVSDSPASLESVLVEVVRGGCIGETLAAHEAALTADWLPADAAARRVWEVIAQDEAQHALLAWRFVAWALEREPGLAVTVGGLLSDAGQPLDLGISRHARRHGLLPDAARRRAWVSGHARLVFPTWAAMAKAPFDEAWARRRSRS